LFFLHVWHCGWLMSPTTMSPKYYPYLKGLTGHGSIFCRISTYLELTISLISTLLVPLLWVPSLKLKTLSRKDLLRYFEFLHFSPTLKINSFNLKTPMIYKLLRSITIGFWSKEAYDICSLSILVLNPSTFTSHIRSSFLWQLFPDNFFSSSSQSKYQHILSSVQFLWRTFPQIHQRFLSLE
jgi:hypothetical protein